MTRPGPADETVEFGVDGTTYEIDLSDANAAKLRDALADYVAHPPQARRARRAGRTAARPASSADSSRPSGSARVHREQNRAIREWARHQGMVVSDRCRISAEVSDAYYKAHQPERPRGPRASGASSSKRAAPQKAVYRCTGYRPPGDGVKLGVVRRPLCRPTTAPSGTAVG